MTPDEQARLARVEAEMREFRKRFESMDRKIDGLCEIAAMGKGAWYACLRIGGILTIAGAGLWAVYTFMKGMR